MSANEILDEQVVQQKDDFVSKRHWARGGKRFTNYIIDLIIVYFLTAICGVLYAINIEEIEISRLLSYAIGAFVIIIYYCIFEGLFGRSIGKMITKTRVVNKDFSKPMFLDIFVRSVCRLIPFEQFSFLGEEYRGWHDSISDTYVVEEKFIG